MTSNKMKNEFEKIGYELGWMKGSEGQGWYLRKHGNNNYEFIAKNSEQAEAYLDNMTEYNDYIEGMALDKKLDKEMEE